MLAVWSQSILSWQRAHCDVYVYLDNDQKSAVPMDALAMLRLLAKPASSRTHDRRVGEERGRPPERPTTAVRAHVRGDDPTVIGGCSAVNLPTEHRRLRPDNLEHEGT
jgi:hypothetical protein